MGEIGVEAILEHNEHKKKKEALILGYSELAEREIFIRNIPEHQ